MRAFAPSCGLLLAAACAQQPAALFSTRKAELVRALQTQLARSVEAEKRAVLATTDEASERFAAESRSASAEVERLRAEVRPLATPGERERLDAFDAAWAKVAAIDQRLLPLATANTNLKAAALSAGPAARTLDQVLEVLAALEEGTSDPQRLRDLSAASVAALRIQALHAPHIAAAADAEMEALEARARALEAQVDGLLAAAGHWRPPARVAPDRLAAAAQAWSAYKAGTAKVFELSRANSNVRSFEMSLTEKAEASRACDAALQALVTEVHAVHDPTR